MSHGSMPHDEAIRLVVPEDFTEPEVAESDQARGCACTLFAAVSPPTFTGFGIVSVSFNVGGTAGIHLLTFDRDISNGACVGSIGAINNLGFFSPSGEMNILLPVPNFPKSVG